MRSDDLAPLIAQAEPDIDYRQGRLVAYDPTTGENTVRVAGSDLTDLPLMSGVEVTSLKAGMVVGLLRVRSQYFILGRIVVPSSGAIVEQGLAINGSLTARHPSGIAAAHFGNLSSATSGAESGAGILVQGEDGGDVFRAKNWPDSTTSVIIGSSTSKPRFVAFTDFTSIESETDVSIFADQGSVTLDGLPSASSGVFIVHATTSSSANAHISTGGLVRRSTSSARYKQDIEDHYVDPSLVLELQPRSWRDKGEVADDPDTENRYMGLIAEEVHELGLSEFVAYNEDGEPESVAYDRLAVGLLDTLKAQQAQIDALTAWAESRGFRGVETEERPRRDIRAVPRRIEPPRRPVPEPEPEPEPGPIEPEYESESESEPVRHPGPRIRPRPGPVDIEESDTDGR